MIDLTSIDEVLEEGKLVSSGREKKYLCPFCVLRGKTPDTKGKFYINTNTGFAFCQRCLFRCRNFSTLCKMLGVDEEDSPAVDMQYLQRVFDETFNNKQVSLFSDVQYPDVPDTIPVHEKITPNAWEYLTSPKGTLNRWGIECRGLTKEQIKYYNIQACTGSMRNRVFIPVIDDKGKVPFWTARSFDGTQPKYINPECPMKNKVLFNLNKAVNFEEVVICEGVFSAIAAGKNAVALFGKYMSPTQLKKLCDADFSLYIVALDGDAIENGLLVAESLHREGKKVTFVPLPEDDDPDSLGNKDFWNIVANKEKEVFSFEEKALTYLNKL